MGEAKRMNEEEREKRVNALMEAATAFFSGGTCIFTGLMEPFPWLIAAGCLLFAIAASVLIRQFMK